MARRTSGWGWLCGLVVPLAACGGAGKDGRSAVSTTEPAGANCENGGVKVQAGNGTPTYVCNGKNGESVAAAVEEPGANCERGGVKVETGSSAPTYVCNGVSGESVTANVEEAGANCEHGGIKIQMGANAPTYVCNGKDGSDGQSTAVTAEGAGANCVSGGVKIQVGAAVPTYVCNGKDGASGVNGTDGQSAVVTTEPAGDNCANGGARIQVGPATPAFVCNGSNSTESPRLTPELAGANCVSGGVKIQIGSASPTYVCNGKDGTSGGKGADGQSAVITVEPAGGHCENGGVKVQVGTGPASYVCNGATGPAATSSEWTAIGTDTQAQPNKSYVVNGITKACSTDDDCSSRYCVKETKTCADVVTVTAPPSTSLAVGDTIRIAGANGWRLLLNANQNLWTISGESTTKLWQSLGPINSPGSSGGNFSALATSSDGTRVVVAGPYPSTYTSTDSGYTWTTSRIIDPTRSIGWPSMASSSDGTKLVVGAGTVSGEELCGGTPPAFPIYTSTDSGSTWTTHFSAQFPWTSVASSASGTKLVAATRGYVCRPLVLYCGDKFCDSENGENSTSCPEDCPGPPPPSPVIHEGQIYTSTDSGLTWSASGIAADWVSVASSSDGSKLVAVPSNGPIYTSTDSGATWVSRTASSPQWTDVTSSADGSKLVAVAYDGIYRSTDSGATWTLISPSYGIGGVASSSDGSTLVATRNYSSPGLPAILTSTDSGATWEQHLLPAGSSVGSVVSSSDGSKVFALGNRGIFTLPIPPHGLSAAVNTQASVELVYLGNDMFQIVSYVGAFDPF